jgi:hypothetical protein
MSTERLATRDLRAERWSGHSESIALSSQRSAVRREARDEGEKCKEPEKRRDGEGATRGQGARGGLNAEGRRNRISPHSAIRIPHSPFCV